MNDSSNEHCINLLTCRGQLTKPGACLDTNVSDQLQKKLLAKYMIFSQYSAHCGTLDLYLLPIMKSAKYVMALKVFNCTL